jgi:2,3-bisphosphoglycerate-independent phosphoglycerate mutase
MRERCFIRAVEEKYRSGCEDYWMPPIVFPDGNGRIKERDTVIFCCRRGEREVQLMESFVEKEFRAFDTVKYQALRFIPLVEYHEKYAWVDPLICPIRPILPLGEVLSTHGVKQLAVSESEKEAHVTFFFNGRHNHLFPGQQSYIIPSWKDFKNHPEMKSAEIAKSVVERMDQYRFIIINFPAGDIIGHLPEMDLKVRTAEEVDKGVGQIVRKAAALNYTVVITADHGLMERGKNADGSPSIAHTTALVPFIVVQKGLSQDDIIKAPGSLIDVAPTILALFGIPSPEVFEGKNLLKKTVRTEGVVLIILDGWGEGVEDETVNPLKKANTPTLDYLREHYPFTQLRASEEAVGLPPGRSGNSETGHLTIGAGRKIEQDETRLQKEIDSGFSNNLVLKRGLEPLDEDSSVHLIGLLSEASSHGNILEMISIGRAAKKEKQNPVYLHLILDGRSAPPRGAVGLLQKYAPRMTEFKIASLIGRGYALDRNHDYVGKTKVFYDAMVFGKGEACRS